jgi:hypothetical protein
MENSRIKHLRYGSSVYLYHFSDITKEGHRNDGLGRPSLPHPKNSTASIRMPSGSTQVGGFVESSG